MITKNKFETKYLKIKVSKTWNSCIKAKTKNKNKQTTATVASTFSKKPF